VSAKSSSKLPAPFLKLKLMRVFAATIPKAGNAPALLSHSSLLSGEPFKDTIHEVLRNDSWKRQIFQAAPVAQLDRASAF
jgi:hypothetical protein